MKKLYICLMGALLAVLTAVGAISLLDTDPTVLADENRKIEKPKFSWGALLDGSYVQQLESYYTDTFPFREKLMPLNQELNKFYYYSGVGDSNYLAINFDGGAEQGGESLHDVENALNNPEGTGNTSAPETTDPSTDTSEQQTPSTDNAENETTTPPEVNVPDENQGTAIGTIYIDGDNAMDIPTANNEVIDSYADAVNNLSQALGSDVRTISLVTPNSGEFYSPESFHTGSHSQKEMIERCYGAMNDNIVTVDAYSALRNHADEYIYFRTDHHWTALGAYYAYTSTARLRASTRFRWSSLRPVPMRISWVPCTPIRRSTLRARPSRTTPTH